MSDDEALGSISSSFFLLLIAAHAPPVALYSCRALASDNLPVARSASVIMDVILLMVVGRGLKVVV